MHKPGVPIYAVGQRQIDGNMARKKKQGSEVKEVDLDRRTETGSKRQADLDRRPWTGGQETGGSGQSALDRRA